MFSCFQFCSVPFAILDFTWAIMDPGLGIVSNGFFSGCPIEFAINFGFALYALLSYKIMTPNILTPNQCIFNL